MAWKCLPSSIGLLLIFTVAASAEPPTVPPDGYAIKDEYTTTSPDGATTIEQYVKEQDTGDLLWQIWARRADTLTRLDPADVEYTAGFRFTNDSHWLVRVQKTGSGEADMYLYRLGPAGFVAATAKPLSDLAWAYLKMRPDWHKIRKPDFHIAAGLVKGVDDNYHWMGENWPDSRYIVISLSGDVLPNRKHGQILSVHGWHCRYDLQNGRFDVPGDFADDNAKAIVPE
jgi:hypothetical protein